MSPWDGSPIPNETKPSPKRKQPKQPPPAPSEVFPDSLDGLEEVRGLGGSTGAKLVKDPATGKRYVLKRGVDPGHLEEEMIADSVYRTMGVKVPAFRRYDSATGPVKLSEFVEDSKTLSQFMRSSKTTQAQLNKVRKRLQDDFALDALMGNWDVVGLEMDNILVDSKGIPWRIDNGGAFRRRAMGGLKGKAWNQYPSELWTLRDSATNSQAAAVFGDLKYNDLLKQMSSLQGKRKREKLLAALPQELKGDVQERLDLFKDIVKTSRTLQKDSWVDDYIDGFAEQSVKLRASGIIDKLPEKLTRQGRGVTVKDERGVIWDSLRGHRSLLYDVFDYINGNGGDSGIVSFWAGQQGGSSWSRASQALKYRIAAVRSTPKDGYFWLNGLNSARVEYENTIAKLGKAKYDKTMQIWHVFNYEQLRAVKFTGNNITKGFVEIGRTEARKVISDAGIRLGDKGVQMLRGAAESGSIYETVNVGGGELTLQRVPHHRIIGNYFWERNPGRGGTMFYGDRENEFVFIPEGIEFDYVDSVSGGQDLRPYWRKR